MRLPRRLLLGALAAGSGCLVAVPTLGAEASYAAAPVRAATQANTVSTAVPGLTPWPGHPDRHLVAHVVSRGETVTGLATRYHAWTRELLALNHLTPGSMLRVGQRLRIPAVTSRSAAAEAATPAQKPAQKPAPQPAQQPAQQPRKHLILNPAGRSEAWLRAHGWARATMTKPQVRRLVVRTAKAHGVAPELALAVAWQESGWRQTRRSGDNALGVMQVLPATGEWMELHVGRPLNLKDTRDNVLAGVTLLRYLADHTTSTRRQVGAYYQGLGGIRAAGLYEETQTYVANVLAIRRALQGGWLPA